MSNVTEPMAIVIDETEYFGTGIPDSLRTSEACRVDDQRFGELVGHLMRSGLACNLVVASLGGVPRSNVARALRELADAIERDAPELHSAAAPLALSSLEAEGPSYAEGHAA